MLGLCVKQKLRTKSEEGVNKAKFTVARMFSTDQCFKKLMFRWEKQNPHSTVPLSSILLLVSTKASYLMKYDLITIFKYCVLQLLPAENIPFQLSATENKFFSNLKDLTPSSYPAAPPLAPGKYHRC